MTKQTQSEIQKKKEKKKHRMKRLSILTITVIFIRPNNCTSKLRKTKEKLCLDGKTHTARYDPSQLEKRRNFKRMLCVIKQDV